MHRIIPATMATQHPDNASAPYWETDGEGIDRAFDGRILKVQNVIFVQN